ncbi:hypothetical protein GF339_01735 [candidate division KSB3 bacterium]|uniref:DUF6036 domain-containing protein n=1 Tax=candidate division KSB3 bacterium TaxID=2044937 RepID=A0A9D5JSN2_9BACT|nr:hypothetical protein [candidate division KSB3 bacterium]MBD3323272.1 hypothetical protein [candidate division KSB3 bacterium]
MGIHDTLTAQLQNVLQVLEACQVKYALAGGLAYSALVEPRATMDIDLLIMLQETSLREILRRLEPSVDSLIAHQAPMQFHRVKIWRVVLFKHNRELILDLLLAESPFHQNALERAVPLDFLGISVNVVTLEDLMLLKKSANRPQDMADVANIYATFGDELDQEYLEFWSNILNLE